MTVIIETDFQASFLPMSLLEIAELIGLAAVHSLVRRYGGNEVYIPDKAWLQSRVDTGHELIDLLGCDGALKLAYRYGPGRLKIAKAQKSARMARNVAIAYGHYVQHKSYSKLAGEYGLDMRSIFTICQTTPLHKLRL